MAKMMQVKGIDRMLTSLKQQANAVVAKAVVRLSTAGLFLQRESMKIVPIDTNNLREGAFTAPPVKKGSFFEVVVGYVAAYAIYVHEDLDAKHKPGKFAKYLERPFRENIVRLRQIITGVGGK